MLTEKSRCPHCGWRDFEMCDYPFDSSGSKYRAWCPKCENPFEFREPKTTFEETNETD